jgi:hypothetical protein
MLKIITYTAIGIIALLGIAFFTLNEKKPEGVAGAKAEALAQKMLKAVNHAAWDTTSVIYWTFKGVHKHIWDKKRGFVQVEWDNYKALIRLDNLDGKVFEGGVPISDPAKSTPLLYKAWTYFVNDSFWLNPVSKIYDPGTTRKLVTLPDGTEALLVSYTSGGVTPGDSYLWMVDANGLPTSWKMWVKIIPIGGIATTWEDWRELPSGAKVATSHHNKTIGLSLSITELKAAIYHWEGQQHFSAFE